ncbi:MAG: glycosyltransferase [Acidimicrobiales bacterium]|nr:glycosyltransferase [Acidimicrobiales bacterium]
MPASALGARHVLTGNPSLVVLPQRGGPGAPDWEVLAPLDAVEALAANNLDLAVDPVAGFEAYAWLATSATVVRLRYETSSEGAEVVRRMLAEPDLVSPRSQDIRLQVTEAPVKGPEPQRRLGIRPGVVTVGHREGGLLFDPLSRSVASLNAAGMDHLSRLPSRRWPADDEARAFLGRLVDEGTVVESWSRATLEPDDGGHRRGTGRAGPTPPAVVAWDGPGLTRDDLDPDLVSLVRHLADSGAGGRAGESLVLSPHGQVLRRSLDAAGLDAVVATHRQPGAARSGWSSGGAGRPTVVVVPIERIAEVAPHLLAAPRGLPVVVVHSSEWPPVATRRTRYLVRLLSWRHRLRVLVTGAAPRVATATALGLQPSCVVEIARTGHVQPVDERHGDEIALREAFEVRPEDLVVVSLVESVADHDVEDLLSVAFEARRRELPARFLLVGGGPALAQAQSLLLRSGADRTVTLVEAPPVIDGFLLGADVHLLVGSGRSAPRQVVAAMHAGVPTVAAGPGMGNAARLVRHGGGMWVPGRDPVGVVDVLSHLAGDRPGRRALGMAAHDVAVAHHGSHAVAAVAVALTGWHEGGAGQPRTRP